MIVPTHDCACTKLCPYTTVPRHDFAHTRFCPHTILPTHDCANRSYSAVPSQDCHHIPLSRDTNVPRQNCTHKQCRIFQFQIFQTNKRYKTGKCTVKSRISRNTIYSFPISFPRINKRMFECLNKGRYKQEIGIL